MTRRRRRLWWATGGLVALLAVVAAWLTHHSPAPTPLPDPDEPPWFRDVTEEVGLDFVHEAGPTGGYPMPQSIGSGAAFLDFDGDGLPDFYLLNNGGPTGATNRLYRQLPGGRFRDVSRGSGLDISGYNMGVAVGDVDNDGRPDILVTQFGGVRLFRNLGGGQFADVTVEAGLDNPLWGTSAAFIDYDRDGRLDLVVVNYVVYLDSRKCPDASGRPEFCAPHPFPGSVTKLYRNCTGEPGGPPGVRFSDVTLASGLGQFAGPGLGVVCADFDGDGWPDIFVANDGKPNHLWVSRPNPNPATATLTPRVFTEEGLGRGLAVNALGRAEANMGTAFADVDGDGLLDLFVTHVKNEHHTLWRQEAPGLFRDRTAAAGLTNARWRATGFGAALCDFDHDGAPDLAIANGDIQATDFDPPDDATTRALGPFWSKYAQRNQLFTNDGTGTFRDRSRSGEPFCEKANVGRGLVWGDVDGDGAIDLLVTSAAGPARLYRNAVPARGHWLMVRALLPLGPGCDRDAYGAVITARVGQRRQVAAINPGQSFLCSCDPRAHFGLGAADRVDALTVLWPDGSEEAFPGGPADRVVTLRRGGGRSQDKAPTRPEGRQ